MTGACLPIYFGSFSALDTPKTTLELKKKNRNKSKSSEDSDSEWDSDEDDEDAGVSERLTSSDAWLFPVMGSAVLFGMFLIFKYLNKDYVNMLLGGYFGLVGCLAVAKVFTSIARAATPGSLWKKLAHFKLELNQRGQGEIFKVRFTPVHLVLLVVSVLLNVVYVVTKNWVISNLLALSLALNAISLMSLDSFRTGAIMLGGLFLYDIFWVFGTPVMVAVAREFDAPIKIVWPKNFVDIVTAVTSGQTLPAPQFTMLGLGDIVIPGVFVALALRYDQIRASERKPSLSFTRRFTGFSKPYFTATFVAYIAGLATTMAVMHFFKAAQPALLYLSPACTGAVFLTALVRGEFADVWSWTLESDEEEEENKDKEKTNKESKSSTKAVQDAATGETSATATPTKAKKRSKAQKQ